MVPMAKIVLSDDAPDDAKHFSLANANFDVPFETTDPVVLSNAQAHPWLLVEHDAQDIVGGDFFDTQVRPEDDALSAVNSKANDPALARAELDRRKAELTGLTPLAIDAGLDQDEPQYVGDDENRVAVTLAADETPADPDDNYFRTSEEG